MQITFVCRKKKITKLKKKPSTHSYQGNSTKWCLHAESNYELILTMDPLYHLTMEASASIINTYKYLFNSFSI